MDEAKVLEINPAYGTVSLPNGRDLNVLLRDRAFAPAMSLASDLPEHDISHHEMAIENDHYASDKLSQQSSNCQHKTRLLNFEDHL